MDYKTGSYIIRAQKKWTCESCSENIEPHTKHFARIKEIGNPILKQNGETYKKKLYNRFHINCAIKMNNLNEYEEKLLTNFKNSNESINPKYFNSETKLRMLINNELAKLEKENKLTYIGINIGLFKDLKGNKIYKCGRKGFSDFIVFQPNNKTIFLELKIKNNNYLNNDQINFKNKIESLGYIYKIASSKEDLYNIL